jgi:hypothetical protein
VTVPSVFFYISGHGFGHASREIAVVNALTGTGPGLPGHEIVIRSSAARWLFERNVRRPFTLIDRPCDTGVVQIDSLRLDEQETIRRAADFHRDLAAHAKTEAALLRQHDARLVIADAPPLACLAARAAGLRSVVLSNFTWDWIYEPYAAATAAAPDLIPAIQQAYRSADEAWRLPLHGGFATFDRLVDVPFVARHATHDPGDVRRRLQLPAGAPVALASFGGYGLRDFDPWRLDCLKEWTVVFTGDRPSVPLPDGVRFIDATSIYDGNLRYEDLVRAVDAVVTKPGFGIVAECLANGTPMLYTSRGRFREYEVMVVEMPRFLRCEFLDLDSLLAGRWRDALDRLRQLPPPAEHPRTDGAEVVAEMIRERLNGVQRQPSSR